MGREGSASDGAFIFSHRTLPSDPLAIWEYCVREGPSLEGSLCRFDVKSGRYAFRYDAIYIMANPQDPHHIYIVPGQTWLEALHTFADGSSWILRQCAVELDHVPTALESLFDACQSTREFLSTPSQPPSAARPRRWYRNPSTGVEFDGWSVPPPSDAAQFTYIRHPWKRSSEQAILRMYKHLDGQPDIRLLDNPLKPLIADNVITCTDPQAGSSRQFFVEHKMSTKERTLDRFALATSNWHVLISQVARPQSDFYRLLFAGSSEPTRRLTEGEVGAALTENLRERGKELHRIMHDRWCTSPGSDHADDETDSDDYDNDDSDDHDDDDDDDYDDDGPSAFLEPLLEEEEVAGRREVENASDEDSGDANDEVSEQQSRKWRVNCDRSETRTYETLNDQSWYLGQHVCLRAHSGSSHGTLVFVEHVWSERDKAAYARRRTLPQPSLDSRQVPIAFGRRLYDFPNGERQYLFTTALQHRCTKIRTLYMLSGPTANGRSLDEAKLTLHCQDPTDGRCAQCDEQHAHVQRCAGDNVHSFPAGTGTHPEVLSRIGKCLGAFGIRDGGVWQRCADLLTEEHTYKAYTLSQLLQSTWKHGLRRPQQLWPLAAAQSQPRWAPCHACWAAGQLCDASPEACGRCQSIGLECVRKRCQFFRDPEACGDWWCSEVHETDEYRLLTDEPRALHGFDAKQAAEKKAALARRIPVCNHCWSNGWQLLCSRAKVCHMCKLYSTDGACVRTWCRKADECVKLLCSYAHEEWAVACDVQCDEYMPRKKGLPTGVRLSHESKKQIAAERGRVLRTIEIKSARYYDIPRPTQPASKEA
ncbi:uncharacterized protein N0V89_007616 [Didymosphaeria variabile]|uniref:Uncharacterized protein n=1 Tax=Didymosphaeria variabile TaxID=1932322 RepID=A0A9W9C9N2_9PLEO|nr:uncharacterized protein N0V89_007616 [Didymosphaeria variabile]KAJ4352269.1 hypothetical protein N0V89_007616 [Didymosphaeria variabile]